MRRQVFKYLKSYSTEPFEIDKLIVTAFIGINKLEVIKNEFLKKYIITVKDGEHYTKLEEFTSIIRKEVKSFCIEHLIELFEFVISPSDRIINGAVYTPCIIREYITTQSLSTKRRIIDQVRIADISCGCGGFLYNAAKQIKNQSNQSYFEIFKSQIFGLDIQAYSINRAKLLLTLLALSEGEDANEFIFNLYVGDALTFRWDCVLSMFAGFDVILGNPPYVCSRKLTSETKVNLKKWKVCNSGHPDLYIPFFQIGIENLSVNGILGFITMNSFFKSLNGRSLREYFQAKTYDLKIIDFGTEQIFKSRYTYTCICFIEKKSNDSMGYFKVNNIAELPMSDKKFGIIKYKNLNAKNGWNLQNHEIISRIESTGRPLGLLYKTRNGIATLKNEIYIFNPIDEDNNFYYLQNGCVFRIEKEICREILNSNKLNSGSNITELTEKIIFPYSNEQKPKLLEERYIKKRFPYAYKYLLTKKIILNQRDNGAGKYEEWFAFGRTQSLEKMKYKLFFPHLADKTPNFLINSDENLLFYNGLAMIGKTKKELQLVKKIMESKVFWFYIKNTSKPYTSGYFSFSSNYIRNFGICEMDHGEIDFVLDTNDKKTLDQFFIQKYNIPL